MLYLIGLGLDKDDLSLKAIKTIKDCEKVYLETYTTELPYSKIEIEKIIKKNITEIQRGLIENKSYKLIKEAEKQDIALLVYGDPLAATTHLSLLLESKKAKVKFKVLHNASIFNAISQTGLQLYKFGKTTSIPKWKENYKPTSFYNTIKENQSINAHTLLLIDKGLELREALEELIKASESSSKTIKNKDIKNKEIIICSRLGTKDQKIINNKIKDLLKSNTINKFEEPFCFIIPGSLHFTEKVFLK